jgi:glycosyltransferase involved in cell wall biosynthesis
VHIIVVDDNSPDGTGEIAGRLAVENAGRVSVIHRPGKLGLSTAYTAGFKEALAEGTDLVCSMDADFSHNPRYVPDIVDKINQGYDLVIGSRYVRGGGSTQTRDRKGQEVVHYERISHEMSSLSRARKKTPTVMTERPTTFTTDTDSWNRKTAEMRTMKLTMLRNGYANESG